jgi:hypothetical protein
MLFFEHFRFLCPHLDGILIDRAVADAVIEVENGDAPPVNKVDPLIVGDAHVRHSPASSHD